MNLERALKTFADPPREFGLIPLWFWNDDLKEEVLIAQLRAFYKAGFGGVVPHPRLGLSRRVGYLTDEYFRLLRLVVEEAEHLGMKIILYDEGSYPSGSANGAVVAENPEYASQAISLCAKDFIGPFSGYWRPNTGRALLDRHICTVLGRVLSNGGIDPESLQVLDILPHDILRIDVSVGCWKAMSVWQRHSGGVIRGVLAEEETGHATAPPAADILNPDAVARFLSITHDQYYEHLKEFFGTTIIGMFTDEPSMLGKRPSVLGTGACTRTPKPYTKGLASWLSEQDGVNLSSWLPALWLDYGPKTEAYRAAYDTALQRRLEAVFYQAQSDWCKEHAIALTGHPKQSNELSVLRFFQYPGQDMVHRYIEPGKKSALEGPHSVAAKAATSGARIQGARRILTEVCGGYGWNLTLDEIKWLFDWHLVRGNNLICPHAVYYSIAGRRAWESEPDLGVHNVWWPHFRLIADYARRVSWLLSDGQQVCEVAILADGDDLPWRAARQLYQSQIDFLYVDDAAVSNGTVSAGALNVGVQAYRVVILEGDPVLSGQSRKCLADFRDAGGSVIFYDKTLDLSATLGPLIKPDLQLDPPHKDLRSIHYRKDELDYYLLVNEGEADISGDLRLAISGDVAVWDPLKGDENAIQADVANDGVHIALSLERRQSVVIGVDTARPFVATAATTQLAERRVPLDIQWEVFDLDGEPVAVTVPGDWARQTGYELATSTFCYRADISVPARAAEVWLDLGKVGDIVEVFLDEQRIAARMWAPYLLRLGRNMAAKKYSLEVRVTNSMSNEYEGSQRPSGLISPVILILRGEYS